MLLFTLYSGCEIYLAMVKNFQCLFIQYHILFNIYNYIKNDSLNKLENIMLTDDNN